MTRLEYLYLPFDESKGYFLSQKFGENPGDYPAANGHNGIDWGMFAYQPIYAAREGLVIRADYNPEGYGRLVVIQHFTPEGLLAGRTFYAHLRVMLAKVGDTVKAHDLIGKSGGYDGDPFPGRSSGGHLHFEYRLDEDVDQSVPGQRKYNAIDPEPLLRSWDLVDGIPLAPIGRGKVVKAYQAYVLARPDGRAAPYSRGSDEIRMGQELTVYEQCGDWYRISGNLSRWVPARYVDVLERYEVIGESPKDVA